jgi:hypothetical protein
MFVRSKAPLLPIQSPVHRPIGYDDDKFNKPGSKSPSYLPRIVLLILSIIALRFVLYMKTPTVPESMAPISDIKTKLPKVVSTNSTNDKRRASVVAGTLHAWKGYYLYAWGKDELLPLSKLGSDWFGLGLTIIDSLDLFHIMSHEDPACLLAYNQARDWIVETLDVNKGEVRRPR